MIDAAVSLLRVAAPWRHARLRRRVAVSIVAVLLLATASRGAGAPVESASPISGALVIHGGGKLPASVVEPFFKLAGGESAKLVVIPTAGTTKDQVDAGPIIAAWQKRGFTDVQVLHTTSRDTADGADFVAPLGRATAVWFSGGLQARLEAAYHGTAVERALHALLARGGVIGGTSAGAAVMSGVMIRSGKDTPDVGRGFDLLPGAIVDQHFIARKRQGRLIVALAAHRGLVGYGIDEGTAMIVRGRTIRVVGDSTVTVVLSKSDMRDTRTITLEAGGVADLVAMSRAAVARAQPAFPPARMPTPNAPHGTLVIVGGGGMPREILDRFIEAAGGKDAPIVVVPTALGAQVSADASAVRMFQRAGASHVTMVHAAWRDGADDPALLEPLRKAKGIWYSGGRQWHLVDSYLGTAAEAAMHDVLKRGGVVGGSSAGATIQGEYLVRGNPLGNRDMMAEGYERGLAFFKGVAIDQHFTQRKRHPDMSAVKRAFPQLAGLGLDEATAVIVRGDAMEVVGKNKVAVYPPGPRAADGDEYIELSAGDRYDFKTGAVSRAGK